MYFSSPQWCLLSKIMNHIICDNTVSKSEHFLFTLMVFFLYDSLKSTDHKGENYRVGTKDTHKWYKIKLLFYLLLSQSLPLKHLEFCKITLSGNQKKAFAAFQIACTHLSGNGKKSSTLFCFKK